MYIYIYKYPYNLSVIDPLIFILSLEQNLSQQFSKCRNLKRKKEKTRSFSSSNNARRGGKNSRSNLSRSRGYPETGRVSRPFQLVCHIYVHCFYRGHGSSCEPEAAESSWRDITRCPLCTRFAAALQLSFVFSRRSLVVRPGLNIEASQGSVPLTGHK